MTQTDTQKNLLSLTRDAQARIEQLAEERQLTKTSVDEMKYSGAGGQNTRKEVEEHETRLATATQAQERVKLMTIHAAKGLEFDVVFVVGVEEGLLPHYRSADYAHRLEEERRLLYVAMTRARQHVVLTHAAYRMRWGKPSTPEPSRFLAALPESVAARTKTEGAGSAGGGRRFSGRFAP